MDETSNRIIAQILNADNEVIKQIPPQELVDIVARIRELQRLLQG